MFIFWTAEHNLGMNEGDILIARLFQAPIMFGKAGIHLEII